MSLSHTCTYWIHNSACDFKFCFTPEPTMDFKNKFLIIYLQCCHKSKLNKSGSARANSIFMMPKLDGCVCTFKRSLSQIQQFDICSLCVQRLPALNRTISCNCHSLVSTWLMSKHSREGKKRCSELQDYWWRAHFQRDWSQEDCPTSKAFVLIFQDAGDLL